MTGLNSDHKDNAKIKLLLAIAHLGKGHKNNAKHFLLEAYNLDPENQELTYVTDELLAQVGLIREDNPLVEQIPYSQSGSLARHPYPRLQNQ